MKKSMFKLFVFFIVFLLALVIVGKFMNMGHDNLTMEKIGRASSRERV